MDSTKVCFVCDQPNLVAIHVGDSDRGYWCNNCGALCTVRYEGDISYRVEWVVPTRSTVRIRPDKASFIKQSKD